MSIEHCRCWNEMKSRGQVNNYELLTILRLQNFTGTFTMFVTLLQKKTTNKHYVLDTTFLSFQTMIYLPS